MNIDLIKKIKKNQQKIEQHNQKLCAQAKDIYALVLDSNQQTIINVNSNLRTLVWKGVKQVQKNQQNRILQFQINLSFLVLSIRQEQYMTFKFSPISVKQSHIDKIVSISPNRNDLTRIRMENAVLKEQINSKEKYIDQLDETIIELKKENLMSQYYQNTTNRINKELEIGKKNSRSNFQNKTQRKIKVMILIQMKWKPLCRLQSQKMNNQSNNKKDDSKWLSQLQEEFQIFYTKSQETKNKMDDTKYLIYQLSEINQFLTNKYCSYVQIIKQQKVDLTPLPKASSIKPFAQVFQVQIKTLVNLNQILKEVSTSVEKFSNQYISYVGLQLVSL
ncbi:unnamed protein product [Paramecium primaurelia]|uniref:Uncharacterized protein n=1 Tax=Paramecium primaurelia TaxID=5886 RepID=A0A8S1L4U1_PARPR|nr:unnamed protein product [Paramecium primaurelia]